MKGSLNNRLDKLEAEMTPSRSYTGVDRFIWDGPKDDAALAEAERAAKANNRFLIVRVIVDPPHKEKPLQTIN